MQPDDVITDRPFPPMRIELRSLWTRRDLTYAEAEAYHLREAAKLAGRMISVTAQARQAHHLEEAARNRWYGSIDNLVAVPMPEIRRRPRCPYCLPGEGPSR